MSLIEARARMLERCPYYDGIYDGCGPCWTCRDDPDHCPAEVVDSQPQS